MTKAATIRQMRSRSSWVWLSCAVAIAAVSPGWSADEPTFLSRYTFDSTSLKQWKLPKKLNEISGLAVTPDGRLFAHGDEKGIVYQIDYENGSLIKAFSLGDPAVRGDFEGIALVGNVVYLVTSEGKIYRANEGRDGERVAYQAFDTGLASQCEIEGLALDGRGQDLLLACKESRAKALVGISMIYRWSLKEQRVLPQSIAVDAVAVARRLGKKAFNPSGIDVVGASGHLILVAAHQQAIVETDANGRILAALRFPLQNRHRQSEGIAITPDGRLLIADEGGDGRARLGVYRPAR